MTTIEQYLETRFHAGNRGVVECSVEHVVLGLYVVLHHNAHSEFKLRVYHDYSTNGGQFTEWPNAKTLNRETLTMIVTAFDKWLAEWPYDKMQAVFLREFIQRRDTYRDQLRAMK